MAVQVHEKDYYSLHGIWGAYAALVLGRAGRGAGVAVGDVHPPRTGLFVGCRRGASEPRLLPFFSTGAANLGAAAFREDEVDAEHAAEARAVQTFALGEIERLVSLSGEEWRAGPLSFRVVSFFGEVPDPRRISAAAAREVLGPSLLLVLGLDNRDGETPLQALFGMQGISRSLSDSSAGALLGMADGTSWGFASLPCAGVEEVMDWSVVEAAFGRGESGGTKPLKRLAVEGGLRFTVPAGERAEYVIALGVFRSGVITAGLPTHAYHESLFRDLEDVLECGLETAEKRLGAAASLDSALDASGLSEDRRFLLSHAAHSYVASTELLLTERGETFFVVNEGEYRMKNTLDLTVDQVFWESRFSPWTIRNELESFLGRSSYEDSLGLAFAHDQGVAASFTPPGRSSYELPGLTDCFSFMSFEELLNWSLTACLYTSLTGDLSWARGHRGDLAACVASIRARDANGDGIMDRDSDRCAGGAEITTYDSLDISLGQARNNLYLGVKTWSTLVCLASVLERADGVASTESHNALEGAAAAASTIAGKALGLDGYIPAVFENDNRSRIIPAVEGLAYPGFCGAAGALDPDGPYGPMIRALSRHLDAVLVPGICLDAESGGWKLSSTSRNTWLSKIFLNQYVAERILGREGELTMRDRVHAGWLRKGSADWAATDQVDSSTGRDLGSRLYPRLVTALLWTRTQDGFSI